MLNKNNNKMPLSRARSTSLSDDGSSTNVAPTERRMPPRTAAMNRQASIRLCQNDNILEKVLERDKKNIKRLQDHFRLFHYWDWCYSVDLTATWRRHLVWAKKDGNELLNIVTSRYATTNIFLSLLFSAEVGTYFSPSDIVTQIRKSLNDGPFRGDNLEYSTGIVLIIATIVTGSAILANYTALGVFNSVGKENASIILRSGVGLYAAQLPSRLTLFSIYLFFAFLTMFWWVNLRSFASSICLTVIAILFLTHVIWVFSVLGRIIMATSAMGETPILPKRDEVLLSPRALSNVLFAECRLSQNLNTKVNKQYADNYYRPGDENGRMTYRDSLRRRHPEFEFDDSPV